MKEFAQKLVERNYKKRIIAILIAAILLFAAIAVLIPVTLHQQITEFRALEKARKEQERMEENITDDIDHPELSEKESHNSQKQSLKAMLRQITPIGRKTKTAFAVVAFLAFLLGVFYWITVAEWLYKTAVLNGLNRALWTMLGLLFNILTIPALLIVLCDPKRIGKQGQ